MCVRGEVTVPNEAEKSQSIQMNKEWIAVVGVRCICCSRFAAYDAAATISVDWPAEELRGSTGPMESSSHQSGGDHGSGRGE